MVIRLPLVAIFCIFSLSLTAAEVPRKSPEFAVILPGGGQQLLLSQHRGKVVAMAFLLTTCPHCQHTTQILSKLQTEYGPRGFQAVGSAIDEMAGLLVPDFIRRFQPTFPVGFNLRTSAEEYLEHSPMLRFLVPQLVFIDRKGMIRAQYAGDDKFFSDQEKNMREMIESLLKENTTQSGGAKRKTS